MPYMKLSIYSVWILTNLKSACKFLAEIFGEKYLGAGVD